MGLFEEMANATKPAKTVIIKKDSNRTEAYVTVDGVYHTGFNFQSEDYAHAEAGKLVERLSKEYKEKGYTVV